MDELRDMSLLTVKRFASMYWQRRDIEELLSMVDPQITWANRGWPAQCQGIKAVRRELEREREKYPGPFLVAEENLESLPLSEESWLVVGHLVLHPAEGVGGADLDCRLSAVCVRRPEGIRLTHLHMSGTAVLQKLEEPYDLMDYIPGGLYQCRADKDLTLVRVSAGFLRLCGYDRAVLRDKFQDRLLELIHPQDRPLALRQVALWRERGGELELECRLIRGNGSVIWLFTRGSIRLAADGTERLYGVAMDVTRRREMEEELRLSLERHRIIIDQSSDVIFEWDIREDKLYCAPNWVKKFGPPPPEEHFSRQVRLPRMIHPNDVDTVRSAMEALAGGTPYVEMEVRMRGLSGEYLWCRVRVTAQADADGQPIKVVGLITDIDADKRYRQQLLNQASRDALTGLLNRSTLQARVEAHLSGSAGPHAMMIMDLDNFKAINDSFGHLRGDSVLSAAATILRRVFRPGDVLGRMGGDEFLIFLPNVSSRAVAARKASQLISAVAEISLGKTAHVSCSVGISMAPADGNSYHQLYHLADRALYQVKKTGKGSYAFSCGGNADRQPSPEGTGMRAPPTDRPHAPCPPLSESASGRAVLRPPAAGDADYTNFTAQRKDLMLL